MRILLHCPLNASYPRLFAKSLTSLFEQESDRPYEIVYGVSKGIGDAVSDRASKKERARRIALDSGYDALLIVEYDIEVPTDTLVRLADVGAPIVCAVTIERTYPYRWQMGQDSGCTLYQRAVLEDDEWLSSSNTVVCVDDLYCTRISPEDGGKMLTPDPDAEDGVNIVFANPQNVPTVVPYSKTLLQREAA